MRTLIASVSLLCLFCSTTAWAQYTPAAAQNAPKRAYRPLKDARGQLARDAAGKVKYKVLNRAPGADRHGNASGSQYDLAVDGAFKGQTILILDQVRNTLVNTRAALRTKGFSTVVIRGTPPVKQLRDALARSCQVWLISAGAPRLKRAHLAAIKAFFDAGHGVYIWGDNDPLYADANRLATALIPGLNMLGNHFGDRVVGVAKKGSAGVRAGHLITTGVQHLYEGVTIATIRFGQSNPNLKRLYGGAKLRRDRRAWRDHVQKSFTPLLHGSAGNLVSAAYDARGKRLVIDGGFTRLAVNWDDAGTARYVKNAAAWLVNAERFRDKVARR
jgi:hypothetical protein